jgi:HAUS augmin-like complex subunit 4
MMTTGVRSADAAGPHPSNSLQLPERVKLAVEDVEVEEAALLVDLYAADRKFSEYYNVLEQILGILLRLIKEFKLQHQHEYVGVLSKFSLCISMWVLVDTC